MTRSRQTRYLKAMKGVLDYLYEQIRLVSVKENFKEHFKSRVTQYKQQSVTRAILHVLQYYFMPIFWTYAGLSF
jgi:hypothetical protein